MLFFMLCCTMLFYAMCTLRYIFGGLRYILPLLRNIFEGLRYIFAVYVASSDCLHHPKNIHNTPSWHLLHTCVPFAPVKCPPCSTQVSRLSHTCVHQTHISYLFQAAKNCLYQQMEKKVDNIKWSPPPHSLSLWHR